MWTSLIFKNILNKSMKTVEQGGLWIIQYFFIQTGKSVYQK